MHITYEWERMIGSIVFRRARSALRLGVSTDDLLSVGRLAAIEAVESWEPEGGRTLASWVYLPVEFDVMRVIRRAAKELAADSHDWEYDDDSQDLDAVVLLRRSLGHLRARLPSLDWAMLWLAHAEGWSCAEIARDYDMTATAVWQRLSRARRKAVRILAERDIEEIGAGDGPRTAC